MTAIEVNPLEVVIAFFTGDAGVSVETGGRIAPRHQYGNGWDFGQKSLVIQPSGGAGSPYVADQEPFLRCEAFGADYLDCFNVYRAVAGAVRGSFRQPVALSGGYTGLLRNLVVETEPSLLFDPEVQMPVLYFFVRAMVAETAVITP